jgi:hypothetical protein
MGEPWTGGRDEDDGIAGPAPETKLFLKTIVTIRKHSFHSKQMASKQHTKPTELLYNMYTDTSALLMYIYEIPSAPFSSSFLAVPTHA